MSERADTHLPDTLCRINHDSDTLFYEQDATTYISAYSLIYQ